MYSCWLSCFGVHFGPLEPPPSLVEGDTGNYFVACTTPWPWSQKQSHDHIITQRTVHFGDSVLFRLSSLSFCPLWFSNDIPQAVRLVHLDSRSFDLPASFKKSKRRVPNPDAKLSSANQDERYEHFFKQCSRHRPAVTGLSHTAFVDAIHCIALCTSCPSTFFVALINRPTQPRNCVLTFHLGFTLCMYIAESPTCSVFGFGCFGCFWGFVLFGFWLPFGDSS